MAAKKKTNYEKFKEDIIIRAAEGSMCGTCPARDICKKLEYTKEGYPPCHEAWIKWANEEAEQ